MLIIPQLLQQGTTYMMLQHIATFPNELQAHCPANRA